MIPAGLIAQDKEVKEGTKVEVRTRGTGSDLEKVNEEALEEFRIQHAEAMARQQEEKSRQAEQMAREMEYRARAMVYGDQNASQLMLSKSYKGTDADNSGVFQVEETVKNIRINMDGSVKAGKIKISIFLPGGELFKEMTIDEAADVRYSQSFNITEDQGKYIGNWKYRIKSEKAEGSYRLSIGTN